ncbi:MAG TPA: hypothetical protein VJV78_20560 [Polyangiales bacterium]|nr:hypothetical protein [Polyangiales bacterium]
MKRRCRGVACCVAEFYGSSVLRLVGVGWLVLSFIVEFSLRWTPDL